MQIQKFMKKYTNDFSLTPDFYHHWDTCIHEDFPKFQPKLRTKHNIYAPDVFLVNLTTKCIFHIYDDRGCEIMNINKSFHSELIDYFKVWEIQWKP